ncbi:hypothetical protein HMSSN036_09950 [Paenibacillus macerans]|nr:hypothetical protein HMSSN036_09950 [Paenibacillus macerans]
MTAFVELLGPIARISGSAGNPVPERTVKTGPNAGKTIPVHTPTHYSATLDFAGGAIGTLVTSFDVPGGSVLPRIEITGPKGRCLSPTRTTLTGT